MALLRSTGGTKAPAQSSRSNTIAVGSGSRPTRSKIEIKTSAPDNSKTRGRSTAGAMRK